MGQPASQRDTRGLWHITRTAIQPAYSGDLDRQRAGLSGAERSRCDGGCVHAVHRLWSNCWRSILPWLLVAHYREESIVKRWQQDPLWQMLTAAQKQQVASVDSNTWARMRGIFAAERIAADTVKIFHHQPLTVVK